MANIVEEANKRILVLDGGMGTMIQQYNLQEEDYKGEVFKDHPFVLKGNSDVLCMTKPEIIEEIHTEYLKAGADIIETNTFTATSIAQEDYGLQDNAYEMNLAAAKVARKAVDKYMQQNPEEQKFVAGSIGPTNKTASLSPDVNDPGFRAIDFDTLKSSYKEQAEGLWDGGVDLFLVETVFDTLNAKAALFALMELFEEKNKQLPIMISGTITDASGRTLSGQTTEAFLISVSHAPLFSIGLNCALGAEQLRPYLQVLAAKAPFKVSAHPNAGLPNEFGEYDQSAEEMGEWIESFMKEGLVNIVGGCCGTTPQHIKRIAEIARKYEPRKVEKSEGKEVLV